MESRTKSYEIQILASTGSYAEEENYMHIYTKRVGMKALFPKLK
jgi:hypothetical protein